MRVTVKVVPRARMRRVQVGADGALTVHVTEPPVDGRANEAVCGALAEHFGVSTRAVTIVRGHAGRRKLVDILT